MKRVLWLALILTALCVSSASAITINLLDPLNGTGAILYNTGVDSNGNVIAAGQTDSHYTWRNSSGVLLGGGAAYAVNPATTPTWAANVTSGVGQRMWISPVKNASNNPINYAQGGYQVWTQITLPGTANYWTVSFGGASRADNTGSFDVRDADGLPLDGASFTGVSNSYDPANSGNTFSFDGIFQGGRTYTIIYFVNNTGTSASPTGLRVSFSYGTATGTPEPGTYALMSTVGAALFFLARRRRNQSK